MSDWPFPLMLEVWTVYCADEDRGPMRDPSMKVAVEANCGHQLIRHFLGYTLSLKQAKRNHFAVVDFERHPARNKRRIINIVRAPVGAFPCENASGAA